MPDNSAYLYLFTKLSSNKNSSEQGGNALELLLINYHCIVPVGNSGIFKGPACQNNLVSLLFLNVNPKWFLFLKRIHLFFLIDVKIITIYRGSSETRIGLKFLPCLQQSPILSFLSSPLSSKLGVCQIQSWAIICWMSTGHQAAC